MLIFVLAALFPAVSVATARIGSYSTQPYAATPIMNITFDFYGEGIAYDVARDRVLLGTFGTPGSTVNGRIYGVPYVDPDLYEDDDVQIVYGETDMTLVYYDPAWAEYRNIIYLF